MRVLDVRTTGPQPLPATDLVPLRAQRSRRRPVGAGVAGRRARALLVLSAGLLMVAKGLWIPAKAELAQFLLERAWQKTLDSSEGRAAENSRTLHFKPWSWADTWPVARLTLPDPSGRQGRSLIVLAGTSGQAMAFGPGMQEHHPLDSGEFSQNLVIGGHRDTHFAGLQHLAAGEVLDLQLPGESPRRYRVNRLLVTHESDRSVLLPSSRQQLTLVTCYPFDAIIPGGPLRFVVQAERLS